VYELKIPLWLQRERLKKKCGREKEGRRTDGSVFKGTIQGEEGQGGEGKEREATFLAQETFHDRREDVKINVACGTKKRNGVLK